MAKQDFLFSAARSNASKNLPEYFLIYFLFNDLLEYKNLGRFEKIAWSFPIDYKGKGFLIEYRKFGIGLFVQDIDLDETEAVEIVKKVNGAVKSARPFYDFLAEKAVKNSKFNIVNKNRELYSRFEYLLSLYKKEIKKYLKNINKSTTKHVETKFGIMTTSKFLGYRYYQNANWLAISCIESFFSWTEHLFIHLAVVGQNLSDGEAITQLIDAEWKIKFKAAIPETSKEAHKFYDELLIVRQQLRNFVAHGAFGKDRNAFKFHSGTGAVPVLMNHKMPKNRFSLHGQLTFKEEEVIKLIQDFIFFLWNGSLKPAMFYTQECALPTVLTLASSGLNQSVTVDIKTMKKYAYHMLGEIDNAANMDW